MKRLFAFSPLAVLVLTLTRTAAAQQDDETAKLEAQARFSEGLTLHDIGKDEDARSKFVQAYAILKHPNVLFNLARSEQLSGHFADAIQHFKKYARDPDPQITAEDRATAKRHVDELSKKVGRITVVAPAGWRVLVDGVAVEGDAPLAEPIDVGAGKHAVTARRGATSKSVEVLAPEGVGVSCEIVEDAPVARPRGFFTTGHTVGLVVGGVALLAIGVGAYFAIDASDTSSKAEGLRATLGGATCLGSSSAVCQSLGDLRKTFDSDRALETGFFIGGGVLAAGAIASFLFWKTSDAPKTMAITPIVSPRLSGLQFVSRF